MGGRAGQTVRERGEHCALNQLQPSPHDGVAPVELIVSKDVHMMLSDEMWSTQSDTFDSRWRLTGTQEGAVLPSVESELYLL